MTGIDISVNLITTSSEFQKMAMEAIRDELNKRIPLAIKPIEEKIANSIKRIFIVSNEYDALVNGPLNAHFGIPQAEAIQRLDEIINKVADSVVVEFKRISVRGDKFTGGLDIKAVNGDFSDVLSLPAARVELDSGGHIPWLEWLLLRGDSIILAGYEIKFGNYPQSRSGSAIMVKNDIKAWKVPIGVSGTVRDNWFTRAVENSFDFLDKLIDKAVQDSLDKVF